MTRRRRSFLLVLVAAVLAAMLAAPTATATSRAAGTGSKAVAGGHDSARAARATQALTEARTLFAAKAQPRRALLRHGRDATLVLNRLGRLRGALTGADRARADHLLARPTDGAADPDDHGYQPGATLAPAACGPHICVHYVTDTADAPDLTDGPDANTTPDYVDKTLALVESVRATYVGAGYKAPESDKGLGGNNNVDIYLVNIGPAGLYGYCNSDKPFPDPNPGPYDGWAYCVFDNDYAPSEFPTNTPVQNLKVTAAHEFFHAVQFAYDYYEDSWFMEATATWAEDEVFDGVDDNVQYLSDGPQARPRIPLDKVTGLHQYGDWIFFRYLTERLTTSQNGLPTLVRQMWRRADGSANGPDDYSIQAVRRVLAARGKDLGTTFAQFASANRRPASTYAEAAANHYPVAPLARTFTLEPSHKDTGTWSLVLDHLSSGTLRYVPSSLGAGGWQIRLQVNAPPRARGSVALATTYLRNGKVSTVKLPLDASGDATKTLGFSGSRVKAVELTLANAGTHYRCWDDPLDTYSCSGTPRDDNLTFRFRATAIR